MNTEPNNGGKISELSENLKQQKFADDVTKLVNDAISDGTIPAKIVAVLEYTKIQIVVRDMQIQQSHVTVQKSN